MMRGVLAYLAAILMAGTVQAGAWEEFERRCLVPMENVETPVTEGLLIATKLPGIGFYVGDGIGMFVTDYPEGGVMSCSGAGSKRTYSINGDLPDTTREFIEGAIYYFRENVASERYLFVSEKRDFYSDSETISRTYHSNLFREPVLAVTVSQSSNGGGTVSVMETDLES